jgi:hypothetical protein
MAAIGSAEKRDEGAAPAPGEPRPTRAIRPIPPLVKTEKEEGASETPAAPETPAATPDAAKPESSSDGGGQGTDPSSDPAVEVGAEAKRDREEGSG